MYLHGMESAYDEQLVRRMIGKIVVFLDRFEFTFKSGTSITLKI